MSITKGAIIKTASNLGITVLSKTLASPNKMKGITRQINAIAQGWSIAKSRNQFKMFLIVIFSILTILSGKVN